MKFKNLINFIYFSIFFSLTQTCLANNLDERHCDYRTEFKVLYYKLESMLPLNAMHELEEYKKKRDKVEIQVTCEGMKNIVLIYKYESKLFQLSTLDINLKPQSVYRCGEIQYSGLQCNGIIADDTAHATMAGIVDLSVPKARKVLLSTKYPGLILQGVYVHSIENLFNQKKAVRLKGKSNYVILPTNLKGRLIIAIYKEKSDKIFHKVIWYF